MVGGEGVEEEVVVLEGFDGVGRIRLFPEDPCSFVWGDFGWRRLGGLGGLG